MPPPLQIKIDQAGKPPGVPGQAREDLALGTAVQLTAVGGPFSKYQWTLPFKPVDVRAKVRSSAALSSADTSSTLVQPIDKAGTYRAAIAVDAGFGLGARAEDAALITFYAGSALSPSASGYPRRVPATGEQGEHNAPDAIDPGGNIDGWARELTRWQAAQEDGTVRAAAILLGSSGNVNGPSFQDVSVVLITPGTDFAGAIRATFKGNLWAGAGGGSAPAWVQSTSYTAGTPPSFVTSPGGAGGSAVIYVCTTPGVSSATGAGPTGFGAGLTDGAGSVVRWRSATATMNVYVNPSGGSPVLIATFTTSETFADAAATNFANLLVSHDVTSSIVGAGGTLAIDLRVRGDPSDSGSNFTSGTTTQAEILFA